MRISSPVKYFIFTLILCTFCLAVSALSVAASPKVGRVAALTGDVQVVRAGERQKAQVGFELDESDKIETATGGMVQLKFSDGSSVTIFEKSSVSIAQYGKSKDNSSTLDSAIEIAHGKLRFFVNPKGELKKNAKFKTKSAIMGIRGTSGVIDASAAGDTQLVVLTGKVEVTNPKFPQVPVMVEPNFLTRVSRESAPLPPVVASKDVLTSLVPAAPAAAGFTDDAPVGSSSGVKSKDNQEGNKSSPEKDSKHDTKKQKTNDKEQGQNKKEEGSNGGVGSPSKPAAKTIKPLFSP
ncbi:MAG: hypothetical protein RIR26_1083, partial [Pseudomonadota bacterium]